MIFKKKKLIKVFKNHKILKKEKNNILVELLYQITNLKLSDDKSFLLNYLNIPYLEISHRQFLLQTLISNRYLVFSEEFVKNFNSKNGLGFPLVFQYIKFLKEKNYQINYVKSLAGFYFLVLKEFLKGFKLIFKTLISFSSKKKKSGNYVFFCDLPKSFKNQTDKYKYNLYNWFDGYFKKKNIETCLINQKISPFNTKNNIKINHSSNIFDSLAFNDRIVFIFKSFFVFFYCLINIFNIKNSYKSIMFNEYLLFILASLQKKNKLATMYLYSQASYIYKPLWTYAVEKRGSEVIMYYFACSFDGYYQEGKYPLPEIGTSSMNWKKILIWSNYLKKHYEQVADKSNFVLVSPIFYKDNEIIESIEKPSISVFDIMPYRSFIRAALYPHEDYRNYKTTRKFLEDIISLSKIYKVSIYLKNSKDLDQSKFDRRYINFVKECLTLKNFKLIHTDVSPFQLIEKTNISLSMPWTSTGCIPSFFNKTGYYYDPLKTIDKNDRGVQNGYLISGYDELNKFFKDQFDFVKN
jgi:polysaccharide biosynthesis PFTS motif protein